MHDMDVARNRTTDDQVHWVVWNIPATATGLPEGVPKGSQRPDGSYQISATGPVYRGPGAAATGPLHHYMFEIYALDTKLDVQPAADAFETRANVMKAMQGHVLGKAVYGGLFKRPQWCGRTAEWEEWLRSRRKKPPSLPCRPDSHWVADEVYSSHGASRLRRAGRRAFRTWPALGCRRTAALDGVRISGTIARRAGESAADAPRPHRGRSHRRDQVVWWTGHCARAFDRSVRWFMGGAWGRLGGHWRRWRVGLRWGSSARSGVPADTGVADTAGRARLLPRLLQRRVVAALPPSPRTPGLSRRWFRDVPCGQRAVCGRGLCRSRRRIAGRARPGLPLCPRAPAHPPAPAARDDRGVLAHSVSRCPHTGDLPVGRTPARRTSRQHGGRISDGRWPPEFRRSRDAPPVGRIRKRRGHLQRCANPRRRLPDFRRVAESVDE